MTEVLVRSDLKTNAKAKTATHADFMVIHYCSLDFLCAKADISASNILDCRKELALPGGIQGRLVRYGNRELLDCNLHLVLRSIFPSLEEQEANLSLIVRTETLHVSQETIVALVGTAKTERFCPDLLSLSVGPNSDIQRVPFSEFSLFPFIIRRHLADRGLLAVRMQGERIQYLLDFPALLRRVFTVQSIQKVDQGFEK